MSGGYCHPDGEGSPTRCGRCFAALSMAGLSEKERALDLAVKLLMSWDIKPGQETAYFSFIVHEFSPEMARLGLKPADAWYTVYGDAPQIQTSGETGDLRSMQQILHGEDWSRLKQKLLAFVNNFRQKVVPSTGKFQIL